MTHLNPSSPRSPTAPAPSTPSLAASATSPNAIGNWKVKLATLVALATFAIAPAARAEQPAYTNHAGNAVPVEQWRLALENFRPAAEEAAARDEEVPALGLPSSGFISV